MWWKEAAIGNPWLGTATKLERGGDQRRCCGDGDGKWRCFLTKFQVELMGVVMGKNRCSYGTILKQMESLISGEINGIGEVRRFGSNWTPIDSIYHFIGKGDLIAGRSIRISSRLTSLQRMGSSYQKQ
jgi:hypothetical protein